MRTSHALLATILLASAPFTPAQTRASQTAPTLASVVDHEISGVEKQVIEATEAMPEEKFNFTPESLTIAGDDYKGVRSFAVPNDTSSSSKGLSER